MSVAKGSNYSFSIDIIRITAILLVLILHFAILFNSHLPSASDHAWRLLFQSPAWAGVWILFIVSGYLSGEGFKSGRYSVNTAGILAYFYKKITKIAIPYFIFIFVVGFLYTDFLINNKNALISLLTFTYNGCPGIDGIGATWFISILFQFYLISPLLVWTIQKLDNDSVKKIFILVFVFGLISRLYGMIYKLDYYITFYTFFSGNFDLFLCGLMLPYINIEINKIVRWGVFYAVIIFNYIYFAYGHSRLYWYVFPSIYIISFAIVVMKNDTNSKKNDSMWLNYLFIAIKKIASICFIVYLIHSNIFDIISKIMIGKIFSFEEAITMFFLCVLLVGILSFIISFLAHRLKQTLSCVKFFKMQ